MKPRQYKIVRLGLRPGADLPAAIAQLQALASEPTLAALDELRVVGDQDGGLAVILAGGAPRIVQAAWETLHAWADRLGPASDRLSVAGPCLFETPGPDVVWLEFCRLGPEQALAVFTEAVRGSGLVWSLYGDTWARSGAVPGLEALPFWPTADLAAACIAGPWQDSVPRPIKLQTLVEQWLPSMEEDRIAAVLVPTVPHAGVVVAAPELAAALTS